MKYLYAILLTLVVLSTSGCVGLVAGAATTGVLVATDPRSSQQIWTDESIEFEIAGMNNKAPYAGNVRIASSSYNGVVVLMGQANTEQLNEDFEAKVRKLKGVKSVHSEVQIMQPLDLAGVSNDSWITTKVKSALLTSNDLNGLKIKVITENGEVFLLGYVNHKQADIATQIARNISGVKRVVQAFQYNDKNATS
ncbi:BON domain-containing protein [Vibrio sp. S4M6]|uniref:BON domain-containing protein n=1 Tax=Vibrio sinus TaxID=2946865 RepID=UPI00202A3B13|nr:BON domain-containing protein [Vibrio sinus]MCL9781484.1 BON domain-containing protein [Vibrio sinus]